ncbi:MAG: enoyl-CoA hydratase/isomerase family protein [Myxococcota bacterium]
MSDVHTPPLRLDLRERIGWLHLSGPITLFFIDGLEEVCEQLEEQQPCDTLVLMGSPEHFTQGIALSEFDPKKPLDIHGFHRWEKAVQRLERLPCRTVALLRGACLGAGLQLALACDVRLGVEGASLGLDEVAHGFLPGMATWRLARFIGLGRARAMTSTAQRVSVARALEWGLVDEHLPSPYEPALEQWLAQLPPSHPVALTLNRRLLEESFSTPYEEAVGNFLAAQHRAILSDGFQQTLRRREVS